MRPPALLPVLLVVLLLAACTGGSSPDRGGSTGSGSHDSADAASVDVDTPALRRLKKSAGVAPCRPGGGAPTELPAVTLPCLGGGRSVALARVQGPAVINLFAQWCGPCRKELPFYQRLHTEARGSLQVLGVDYLDTQPAAALELVRGAGVTYPLAADPGGLLRGPFRVRGLPGIVLVDRRGRVVDVEFRSVRSYAELRSLVQRELHVRLRT